MMVLLTGSPGIGKTTVLMKVIQFLKTRRNVKVGGMITREVREDRVRVGFQIIDLATGETGWLAHVKQDKGPVIGKYRVNLRDLENVGVKALMKAFKDSDLIVCDEIGPMEMCSSLFREAVRKMSTVNKPVLGTIHYRFSESLVDELKEAENLKVFKITYTNRDFMPYVIFRELSKFFKG